MKYTLAQHIRSIQGRCLRCGIKRSEAREARFHFRCGMNQRHLWKMR